MPKETYVEAVVREAREEVGDTTGEYINDKVEYKGTFIFRGGYKKDWIAQFFKIRVSHKDLPGGLKHEEGELFWCAEQEFETIENPIWDLPLIWPVLTNDEVTFQAIAQMDNREKLQEFKMQIISENGKILQRIQRNF